jgi:hypothetical protein
MGDKPGLVAGHGMKSDQEGKVETFRQVFGDQPNSVVEYLLRDVASPAVQVEY